LHPFAWNDRLARGADRAALGIGCAAAAWLLLQLSLFGMGRDQAIYSLAGDAILAGGTPYRDVWDFKPPAIHFVYALARGVFGARAWAPRILEALAFASLVLAFARFSVRHMGDARPGAVGGLIALATVVPLGFWQTGQPESFGAVATAWALVCATPARPRTAAYAAAGALYTFAALCKPPLGGGLLVSAALAAREAHRSPDRSAPGVVAAFAAGGAALLAACALFFLAHGATDDLFGALVGFAPHYTTLSFTQQSAAASLWSAVRGSLYQHSLLVPAGVALLVALPARGANERNGTLHVLGVLAFQVAGVALQGKHFPYHFVPGLTLLALLSGWGLWKGWRFVRGRPLALAAGLALVVLLLGLPAGDFAARSRLRTEILARRVPETLRDRLDSAWDVNAGSNRRVAAWIRKQTSPHDRIFVWGFEPQIYILADRRPASRYIYDVPQRLAWTGRDAARSELVHDLRAAPPAAFVVEHRDVLPHVTGNRADSAEELARFSGLHDLLRTHYRHAVRIEDLDVYLRSAPE
jgi:hypothetical protein